MAGGTFDKSVGKVRPGTYINFASDRQDIVSGSDRGTVILPLNNTNYGPAREIITLYASAPDADKSKLGYSVYDDDPNGNMLLIREAFKGASSVIVYICTEGTAAATGTGGGLTATAKYKGTRGNDLSFSVVTNPVSGFDIDIYLNGNIMETFENVTEVKALEASEYITFAADEGAEISAVAGVTLSGGTDEKGSNEGVAAFLTAAEGVAWNTMAFPFTDASLQAAILAKIKHLRNNVGKTVQAVIPSFNADYEGIINVTNSYAIEGKSLTTAQATAYVAGITAGASSTESNTNKTVAGAISVVEPKTHEEAVAAINNGEFFFSVSESGSVVVEYDINSLVTIPSGKDKSYSKNKVIRIFDTFAERIKLNFPPNKFDNDEDGWEIMEGLGRTILKLLGPRSDGGIGAIKNVDYDNDFSVDRELSKGDETFFNVGIEPVDSAEKLYFTVSTR